MDQSNGFRAVDSFINFSALQQHQFPASETALYSSPQRPAQILP